VRGRRELCTDLRFVISEGRRPPRRPKRKWKGNIKVDHKGRERAGVNWIYVGQVARNWTCGFHTVRESSRLDEKLVASQG
jgi:hypothetical protein